MEINARAINFFIIVVLVKVLKIRLLMNRLAQNREINFVEKALFQPLPTL